MFTIQDIINTLNQVEVKGKDNLDRMLGAIMALEAIQAAQNNQAQEKAQEGVEEDAGQSDI